MSLQRLPQRAAQNALTDITPSTVFAETHDYLIQSINVAVLTGDAMREGLLSMDKPSIQLAATSIQESSDLDRSGKRITPRGCPYC